MCKDWSEMPTTMSVELTWAVGCRWIRWRQKSDGPMPMMTQLCALDSPIRSAGRCCSVSHSFFPCVCPATRSGQARRRKHWPFQQSLTMSGRCWHRSWKWLPIGTSWHADYREVLHHQQTLKLKHHRRWWPRVPLGNASAPSWPDPDGCAAWPPPYLSIGPPPRAAVSNGGPHLLRQFPSSSPRARPSEGRRSQRPFRCADRAWPSRRPPRTTACGCCRSHRRSCHRRTFDGDEWELQQMRPAGGPPPPPSMVVGSRIRYSGRQTRSWLSELINCLELNALLEPHRTQHVLTAQCSKKNQT